MKKYFLFLIIVSFFLLSQSNLHGIEVSGEQSGIWLPENNPYDIIGEVTIPEGDSLEIRAGVNIFVQGNYTITALGQIQALGTASDSILFLGASGIFWGGIRLENETEQNKFYHCQISDTDDNNDYGIHSINSQVIINFCNLSNHKKAIQFSGLPSNDPAYMEIKNSKISNCELNGILITDNSNVLVDSCEITECGLGTQYRGAIQLALQNSAHSCNPTITHNWIHHNGKQGITCGNIFNYDYMSPEISNNEVSFNLTGIYLYNARGFYRNNFIHDNYIENDPNTGAGVMLYGPGSNAVFTENHITGNYTGFFLQNNAIADLGNLNNADPDDDGLNMIHDNIFYDGSVYSVVNMSSEDIFAENNVWDHSTPIDETITDGNDDPAYGIVDHEPKLSPFPPPDSVSIGGDTLAIIPPSTPTYEDLFGYNIYLDGTFLAFINQPSYLFSLQPGTYAIGISAVYEDGESAIISATLVILDVLNPPQNVEYEIIDDHVQLTWEEPAPGSTSPFEHYRIYLNGDVYEETSECECDIYGLVSGLVYEIAVVAVYEAGESESFPFEITYTGNEVQQEEVDLFNFRTSPNPFTNFVTISFSSKSSCNSPTKPVECEILNIKGQLIREYRETNLNVRTHSFVWNGTDSKGNPVSSGIYFSKIKIEGKEPSLKKMLLIR